MRSCRPYNLVIIVILLAAQFYPAAASSSQESLQEPSYISTGTAAALAMVSQLSFQNQINTDLDIVRLISVSENKTDTDSDGLPDSVEAVLGTDFNNTDSDFDMLDDYNESVFYKSDPLEPDSNHDGLSDYFEVTDVDSLDADGDGFSNVWDLDNDDDGVADSIDLSPYSHSGFNDSFLFDIRTNGNPTYLTFQVKPRNPDNLKLALQDWDWPYDDKGQMKDLDDSTDDLKFIPMLELKSNVIPAQSDLLEYGIAVSSDSLYIPLTVVEDYGANVAFGGRMFFPASDPLDVSINASLIWLVQGKTDNETAGGIESETVTLAKYNEGCMLTGFEVEENYGTDVGMFYGDSVNQTLLAGFLMAFSYLRDNQTTLYDMPEALIDANLTISSEIESVSHRDVAVFNTTSEMKEQALRSLPENRILPLIAAYQFNFTSKDIDDLVSGGVCVNGNAFDFDLTASPAPAITMKTIKMSWYDTSTNESVDMESFLPEVENWGQGSGLDENTITSMMGMALVWNIGESVVTRLNGADTIFQDAIMEVKDNIEKYALNPLGYTINLAVFGVYLFTSIKLEGFGKALWGAIKVTLGASVKAASQAATRAIDALGVAGKVLTFAAIVLEAAFAIIGFIALLDNGTSFQATVYLTAMTIYLVILTVLLLAGPIGEVIAAIIMIADAIASIFGYAFSDFIGWLVSLFHKTYQDTTVELNVISTSVDIHDEKENGLNVGDTISFSSLINGTVSKTSHGTWNDVLESYVVPHYAIKVWYLPSNAWSSPVGSYTRKISYFEYPDHKNTTYDTGAWIKPNVGAVNFPIPIRLLADYKIIYTEKKLEWFTWHSYRKSSEGTSATDLDTIYFDILPESINDFANWYPISPLDKDGDGIPNSEDPYPWSWDRDGDGLSDKFELDIGTDPGNSDRDGDGLNDRIELIHGTNLTEWDTDGDNLSDYKEINGWSISFNYSNQTFNMSVHSDPLVQDTDGDGVDDQMEYWSSLNPGSRDTDGDGVIDVPKPGYITYVHFEKKWGRYGSGDGQFNEPIAVAVDSEGFVYVADVYNHRIQKFDSNGNFITKWGRHGSGNGEFRTIGDMVVDANRGYVYVSDVYWYDPPYERIQKFTTNGNFVTSWYCNYSYALAVDSDGYVYAPSVLEVNGSALKCIQKFDPSGSLITTSWFESDEVILNGITALTVDLDGNVYVTDGADHVNHGIYKFDSNGTFILKWESEGYPDRLFLWPESMTVDKKGFVYIANTADNHIQKFDSTGWFITRWGSEGTGDGEFKYPSGIAVDANEYVYVSEGSGNIGVPGNRIQKFSQITELQVPGTSNLTDTNGDGLTDINETNGWNVTFTNLTGTFTVHVSSEPFANDTDFEGLADLDEYNIPSNPGDLDTDDDGLNDFVEMMLGTNITHYDTDGDGLDDGTELTFGSDPAKADSDGDGLSDLDEFNYLSNPRNNDTDGDGLNDSEELDFNSSLKNPDSDGDLMFDGEEKNNSADPWDPDSDGDGLQDGYELFYNTSAVNNDTDKDGVFDGEEVDNRMDPSNNDTDGDGLDDFQELSNGTNPLDSDTYGNGLNDSEDPYSFAPNVDRIWAAYDPDDDTMQLIENLEKYTNVTVFKPEEIGNYSGKQCILLIGRPGQENNTAGNITRSILNVSSPDALARMQESDYERFYVEHDIWNTTQTVVMLSHPYPSDHYRVLEMFKTLSQEIEYPDPVSDFKADAIAEMGSFVMVELKNPVKPTIELKPYDETNVPHNLTYTLSGNEKAVKYLDINVSENVMNESSNNIRRAIIVIYYTAEDLDRTGDGDANDPGDIDENSIGISWFNESSGEWEKLSTDMDWVNDLGVNTTNDVIYGREYEGSVWANVSHLSLYGLSGNEIKQPPVDPAPHDGHRRIPLITDEESQDENITLEDQEPLQGPENLANETAGTAETGTLPEIWFYLAAAMIILLTGLGAAYVLRKRT
ncbi:MAG: 6-bladed beta-propeller [Methanosarcinaceae archaeon]